MSETMAESSNSGNSALNVNCWADVNASGLSTAERDSLIATIIVAPSVPASEPIELSIADNEPKSLRLTVA